MLKLIIPIQTMNWFILKRTESAPITNLCMQEKKAWEMRGWSCTGVGEGDGMEGSAMGGAANRSKSETRDGSVGNGLAGS